MNETPRSLFPASSERAESTAKTLRQVLSASEQAELEEALQFARRDIQSLCDDEVAEPDAKDDTEPLRSSLWLDWDDWG